MVSSPVMFILSSLVSWYLPSISLLTEIPIQFAALHFDYFVQKQVPENNDGVTKQFKPKNQPKARSLVVLHSHVVVNDFENPNEQNFGNFNDNSKGRRHLLGDNNPRVFINCH